MRTILANKRRAIALLLILSFSAMAPKCGDPKQVQQVAEAAKDIGGGTRDAIKAVDKAYTDKLITLTQKDRLADMLLRISRGGKAGVAAIEAVAVLGDGTIPATQQEIISAIFTDQVVGPFLDLITEIAKLSPTASVAIRASVSALRTTILLLSQRIGRSDIIDAIHAKEVIYV